VVAGSSRGVRRLTLAAWIPGLLAVLALPFGFIDEDVAVIAGVYGLYFALPGVVAWCLDLARPHLPRVAQRVVGGIALLIAMPAVAVWLFLIGPLLLFALPSVVVVFVVAFRLLRARSTPSAQVAAALASR
jgi:hypothetical protein